MKMKPLIIGVLLIALFSCKDKADSSEVNQSDHNQFDLKAATKIVEQRSKEFEEALKIGDSIAVGDIYTIDSKIIGAYAGRDNLIKEVHELVRDSITDIRFKI